MTEAEKKAKELVDKFLLATHNKQIYTDEMSKQCALIACDTILDEGGTNVITHGSKFWQEVKTAIQAL
jgi:hypothetical protein